MAKIALLGHGVVGTGVVNVLKNKARQLEKLTGEKLELKYVLVRHDYDVDYKEKFVYDDWHLAKRQITWFKRNKEIIWLPLDEVYPFVIKNLSK